MASAWAASPREAPPEAVGQARVPVAASAEQAAPPAGEALAGELPEEALARELRLTAPQAEAVAQVLREAEEELIQELNRLSEADGYDDLRARRVCERYEDRLIERVAQVLPADRVGPYRRLVERERHLLDD